MATIIEMPKLSDTMSVGTVVKWHKKTGDKISNGDVLAEIETDKATMELESFDDGILLKIFVGEGKEVPIGSPLAAIGEDGESVEDAFLPQHLRSNVPLKVSRHEEEKLECRRYAHGRGKPRSPKKQEPAPTSEACHWQR